MTQKMTSGDCFITLAFLRVRVRLTIPKRLYSGVVPITFAAIDHNNLKNRQAHYIMQRQAA